jgi:hypothetical protein
VGNNEWWEYINTAQYILTEFIRLSVTFYSINNADLK